MKILNSSDWHVDASTAGFRRYDDVADAVRVTVEAAIDENVDYYLFTGDFCDPDGGGDSFLYAQYLCSVAAYLADRDVKSIWIAGNHDVVESGSGVTTLSPLNALAQSKAYRGLISCVETPSVIELMPRYGLDNARASMICLPFTSHDRSYDPGKTVRELSERAASGHPLIVAAHLNIAGIEVGSETTDFPRGRDVFFPQEECNDLKRQGRAILKVNGHYHKRQCFEGIHIPGSVARLTFGEANHMPGYQVIEV